MPAVLLAMLLSFGAAAQVTHYYVGPTGSDAHTLAQAQNPATPWATISHADAVLVLGPGGATVCNRHRRLPAGAVAKAGSPPG